MVAMPRLELGTLRLWVVRSNQLSYIALPVRAGWGAYYADLSGARQAVCEIFYGFLPLFCHFFAIDQWLDKIKYGKFTSWVINLVWMT